MNDAYQPDPERQALPAGQLLDNYRIIRPLGHGGFSIVYLAADTSTGQMVAIKELFPRGMAYRTDGLNICMVDSQENPVFNSVRRSFVNEAQMLTELQHVCLVKVLKFWEANGTAYMAMPYYDGYTLASIMKNPKFECNAKQIKHLFDNLLPVLDYLHSKSIYHRDISPDNIFLQKNGQPLLLDFGSARSSLEKAKFTVLLKEGYAPLEQFTATHQGPWTDIYALSAVLYQMISGQLPVSAVHRNIRDTLLPLANRFADRYPVNHLRAIDAGLAVRAENRPASIHQWRQIIDGLVIPPVVPTQPAAAGWPPQAGNAAQPPYNPQPTPATPSWATPPASPVPPMASNQTPAGWTAPPASGGWGSQPGNLPSWSNGGLQPPGPSVTGATPPATPTTDSERQKKRGMIIFGSLMISAILLILFAALTHHPAPSGDASGESEDSSAPANTQNTSTQNI